LRAQNKIEKLHRIKTAARKLFIQKGFDDTTTREIAHLAGVGIGTVFTYADNKRDLLFLIANEDLAEVTGRAEASVRDEASCLQNLVTVFRHHYELLGRQPELSRLMLREMTFYDSGRQAGRFQRTRERNIQIVGRIVADAIEQLVIPTGKGGSVWGAEEFESAVRESVSGPVAVSASPDGDGFHVEVPFGDVPSRCQVLPGAGHPVYGAGLLIMQQLPVTPPNDAEGAGFALALNAIELSREPFGYGFGSYSCRDRCIYFTSFFPNALFRRGVLPNLVVSCAQRARSLRGLLDVGDEETTAGD
jgi:AcrR family transcriptional regulator